MSTLLEACKSHSWGEVIKLLQSPAFKHGELHDTDTAGKTSIIFASREGHLSMVELLLSKGAKIHVRVMKIIRL